MGAVRVAVAVVLIWPVLDFVVEYLWTFRTADGLIPAFLLGFVNSIPDQIAAAAHEPVKALALFALTGVMVRLVRGRHR